MSEISAPMRIPAMEIGDGDRQRLDIALVDVELIYRAAPEAWHSALMPVAIAPIIMHRYEKFLHAFSLVGMVERSVQNISLGSKLSDHVSPGLIFVGGEIVGSALLTPRGSRDFGCRPADAGRAAALDHFWAAFDRAGAVEIETELRPSKARRPSAPAGMFQQPCDLAALVASISLCDNLLPVVLSPPSDACWVERLAPPPDGFSLSSKAATSSALNCLSSDFGLDACFLDRLVGVLAVRRLGGLRLSGRLRPGFRRRRESAAVWPRQVDLRLSLQPRHRA